MLLRRRKRILLENGWLKNSTTNQFLLDGWILRGIVNCAISNLIMTNLFVVVWGGVTTPTQRAIFVIASDAAIMIWSALGESDNIRKYIIQHYVKLLWTLVILDSLLLPLYVMSAYTYLLIFTLLFEGVYILMFTTLTGEVKEVLIDNANDRNKYFARTQKARGAGNIIGAILAITLPISEWGIYPMLVAMFVCEVSCASMTTHIFLRTCNYMREQRLIFHVEKV